jgi:hypothetical protein
VLKFEKNSVAKRLIIKCNHLVYLYSKLQFSVGCQQTTAGVYFADVLIYQYRQQLSVVQSEKFRADYEKG